MKILRIEGVDISAVVSALPKTKVDNLELLTKLSPEKAESIIKSTGVSSRRIAEDGVTPLDLTIKAALEAINASAIDRRSITAVVFVSFTSPSRMPCAAAQAQHRLKLSNDVLAFDISMACSGYIYGLYTAALLVNQTQGPVLLLDGDVQSAYMDAKDVGTQAVLADGASATILVPSATAKPWSFSFMTCGEKGEALRLNRGGNISMDGFGVFRFVASEVTQFAKEFLSITDGNNAEAFVPHQPNVFMVNSLASSLGFEKDKTWLSVDKIGNMSSASIPVTIAMNGANKFGSRGGSVALCGFGGGLSIGAGLIYLPPKCTYLEVTHGE